MVTEPFRIIMEIKTPVILTEFAPSLDGVLYSVMKKHYPNDEHIKLVQRMSDLLTLNSAGFFHGSALRFAVTPEKSLSVAYYTRTGAMRQSDLSSDNYAPTSKRGDGYKRIELLGGPTKNRLNVRPSYAAPFVAFEGLGDGEKIRSLFEYYLFGVGYDADNANCGAIGNIELQRLNEDQSLIIDGKANRCLPTDFAAENNATGYQTVNRLLPPYYHGDKVPVTAPERVRMIPLSALYS